MSSGLRIGLFYAAVFLGSGASLPYMPVWFRAQDLSPSEIGLILSAPMLARAFTAPALAIWADGFALRRTPLAVMMLICAACYVGLGLVSGLAAWLVLWFVAATLLATTTPLTDVLALRRARVEGFNYGWPRGIGSAAFIVANVGVGALLTVMQPDLVLGWIIACAALAALAARLVLPPEPVHESGERTDRLARWRGLGELLRNRMFMLTVVCVGAVQGTHAFYYGFSALAWRREGISEAMVGVLWGFAVAVEIGFMWFMEPWRRKVGPERLLLMGGIAAVVRWTAFAFSPPLMLLFPLQTLHALSFAATYMAGLQLIERYAPARSASAAQTISSALSGGLLVGGATIASGALFDLFGARGYLAMAAMALVGLLGALGFRRLQRSG